MNAPNVDTACILGREGDRFPPDHHPEKPWVLYLRD
jgi:hypothetical protein